ncbi:hypothetical protein GO491_06425 [Flavobacteriaceae bacterium Ap0902]|nr:hypothetical protein [Flavobacteriaceae bacterium Ap0902]
MEQYDSLDFRLQSHDNYIIATMLVNNVPLYDSIVTKHIISTYESDKERNENFLKFYYLETYPEEMIDEEALFYYNFPRNLMPLDQKHIMIGLSPFESFMNFAKILFNTHDFNLDDRYTPQYNDTEAIGEFGEIICLVHTCGIADCDYYQMQIERIASDKIIKWCGFKWARDPLHRDVNYTFKEDNYLEVMLKLKAISDKVKNYKDYLEFKSQNNTSS